ncbi:hypothetical protein [Salmonella phage 1586]
MSNFCSPFVTFRTSNYKDCSINITTVALIISEGSNRCKVYVTGDSIGVTIDTSRECVLQAITDKLRELHYA